MPKLIYNFKKIIIIFTFIFQIIIYSPLVYPDAISEIRKKNEIVFGIKDNLVPFGYIKKIEN